MKRKIIVSVVVAAVTIDLAWLMLVIEWNTIVSRGITDTEADWYRELQSTLAKAWRSVHEPVYSIGERLLFPTTVDIHAWRPSAFRLGGFFALCLAQIALISAVIAWGIEKWRSRITE